MKMRFADRMNNVPRSFIREILKVTEDPGIISFAGGLPSPKSFPVNEVSAAAQAVLKESGESVLQYSTTEGYLPLREVIAKRYKKRGLNVDAGDIMIINGSQQGLDLAAKTFLNKGDTVLVEKPTYFAMLQALMLYEAKFRAVTLMDDGVDTAALPGALDGVKMFYTVPGFQNPTGISYSRQKRLEVAKILNETSVPLIEDDPYGEIRFMGEDAPPIIASLKNSGVLLGSFSKIVSPGMRIGWICAPKEIMEKLVIAKQASDLHTSYFTQRIVHRYMIDNDVDAHIGKIKRLYKSQRDAMVDAIERYFPEGVECTRPEGGMFLWAKLPGGLSSLELFDMAIKENVAFVPGHIFFTDGTGGDTMRLNYTNADEATIDEGIRRLSEAISSLMRRKN